MQIHILSTATLPIYYLVIEEVQQDFLLMGRLLLKVATYT